MSREFIKKVNGLVFDSYVREGVGMEARVRRMDVNLIVMSRATAREIMREDRYGDHFRCSMVKTEPDRCGPARVAYDDSMALGEMLVAEAKGEVR